jgi:hypothetical protein
LTHINSLLEQSQSELEQVKAERDEWEKGYNRKTMRCVNAEAEAESLRTELSAKDKVLECFANRDNWEEHPLNYRVAWIGEDLPWEITQSVLSQYATINESKEGETE